MRKIFRTVAIIALMGMAAASCQKETMVESWNVVPNQAVEWKAAEMLKKC